MHEDPLIEADYMNDDYLEAKSVPGQIFDRPVTGRSVGSVDQPVRSSKIQTGSICCVAASWISK
jgi:hypothetical protein